MSLMLICLVVQIIAYIFVIKLLPNNPNLMWVAKTLLTFYLYWAFGICFLLRKKEYYDDWSKIYPGFSSLNQGI